jgi:hypothetical protein
MGSVGSETASVKQNSAKAKNPAIRPRPSRRNSSAPRWVWVNTASTLETTGNAASGGQREHEQQCAESAQRQIPDRRRRGLGGLGARVREQLQPDKKSGAGQEERRADGDRQRAEQEGPHHERGPTGEQAHEPGGLPGEASVDDDERGQRDQPEQRAGGSGSGEGGSMGQCVDEQDRAGDDRQAGYQTADPRPKPARGERRADDAAGRQQHLYRKRGHARIMTVRRANRSAGWSWIGGLRR